MEQKDFEIIYKNYWKRKEILANHPIHFPVVDWFLSETELSPLDKLIAQTIKKGSKVLDIGAGDLYLKEKLQKHGVEIPYDTLDIGHEFEYTYSSVEQVEKKYSTILLIGVLEHLPLHMGLKYLTDILNLLEEDGTLVIQIPNARCIRSPLSWDMTHLHNYNGKDLYAYLMSLGHSIEGNRIVFSSKKVSLLNRIRKFFSKIVITKLLGADYADGIILFVSKNKV